jgi:hypothetical protein
MLSTIIFIITRGWHNRPGLAAVSIVSYSKKKNYLEKYQEREVRFMTKGEEK